MGSSPLRKVLFATGLLLVLGLAAPAPATPAGVTTRAPALSVTPRRLGASLASLIGLGGLVCAGVAGASAGASGRGSLRLGARKAGLVAGTVSATVGLLVILTARGGFGTGQGLAGGIVALALGLSSVALALRARRKAQRAG
jgi:hypothetical protein